MTGVAYATSAEMAKERGPFPGYPKNREHMLRVMRNHRRAAYGAAVGYEDVATAPVPLDENDLPDKALAAAARRAWDRAVELGRPPAGDVGGPHSRGSGEDEDGSGRGDPERLHLRVILLLRRAPGPWRPDDTPVGSAPARMGRPARRRPQRGRRCQVPARPFE